MNTANQKLLYFYRVETEGEEYAGAFEDGKVLWVRHKDGNWYLGVGRSFRQARRKFVDYGGLGITDVGQLLEHLSLSL